MSAQGPARTVILCGGKGLRAYPETLDVPKPLLEVGGRPVLLRVMEIYAAQGFTDFLLAGGYKIEAVERFASSLDAGWSVDVVDTGEEAETAERIWKVRDRLTDPFLVTYGDGLGNVDLTRLLAHHHGHDGCATLTSVPLPSPYGTLQFGAGGRVDAFVEKPVLREHSINAGFFAMDAAVFDRWVGTDLERQVLPALAAAGELHAYRHEGFWRSMDTYKEALALGELCVAGEPPWLDGLPRPGGSRPQLAQLAQPAQPPGVDPFEGGSAPGAGSSEP